MVNVLETRLHNALEHVRIFNSQYHSWDLDMTTKKFETNLDKWQIEVVVSRVNLLIRQARSISSSVNTSMI